MRYGLVEELEDLINIEGVQYCIYGEHGCNCPSNMAIIFQRGSRSQENNASNQATLSALPWSRCSKKLKLSGLLWILHVR